MLSVEGWHLSVLHPLKIQQQSWLKPSKQHQNNPSGAFDFSNGLLGIRTAPLSQYQSASKSQFIAIRYLLPEPGLLMSMCMHLLTPLYTVEEQVCRSVGEVILSLNRKTLSLTTHSHSVHQRDKDIINHQAGVRGVGGDFGMLGGRRRLLFC